MINKKMSITRGIKRSAGYGGILILPVLLSACSGSPTPNYYSLTPQVMPLASSSVRVIEVLPVGLPDRLSRSPLVIQETNGQSKVLDNERWTSTFDAELRDGLSAGLQQKLGAVDRYSSGMTGGKVSYRIATDFSRFDIVKQAESGNLNIDVAVAWIIKRDDPAKALTLPANASQAADWSRQLSCRLAFQQKVSKGGHETREIVRASSSALNQVVEAVSASVIASEAKTPVTMQGVICSS